MKNTASANDTTNDRFYSGKMKQGKPSRERKEARDNKRVSNGVGHRTRKEEHYKYM